MDKKRKGKRNKAGILENIYSFTKYAFKNFAPNIKNQNLLFIHWKEKERISHAGNEQNNYCENFIPKIAIIQKYYYLQF